MKPILLFTDGSSLGNPGPGGYCALLRYKDTEKVFSGGEVYTTNNKMELKAVIEGLKALKEPCSVKLYTDSQYVQKAIREWLQGWIRKDFKNVKNSDLWREYIEASKPHTVEAFWVKAHNDHPENEKCDTIARGEAEKLKGMQ